jgi:hypothetical protein
MHINWRNTDLIIGHISEALAQHLRQRGKRLHLKAGTAGASQSTP